MERTDLGNLTPTQRDVIALPANAEALVVGGAGTGKTRTLIERIVKLVTVDGLTPGDEVLVLTFGRETAAELRRRAEAAGGDAAYVRVSTFDSFATGLLSAIEPEGTWLHRAYDPRIAYADRAIRDDRRAQSYLLRLRHIIVDEIQDLVGVRADFVLSLLRHSQCGFTLLGDPAQAIFNFQLDGPARERGSEHLFDSLRETYSGLATYTLQENFRAQTTQTQSPIELGLMLGRRDADYGAIRRDLETLLLRAQPAPLGMLGSRDGTIAVLCYTNAQALVFARELFRKGVAHEYRRSLSDQAIPSWVGEVIGSNGAQQISKPELADLLIDTEDCPDTEDAWNFLKAMDRSPGGPLQVNRVAENIRAGVVMARPQSTSSKVTVSTIHRAKGLEFDWVVVVKPTAGDSSARTPAEEARLLLVALTRARNGFFWVDPPETKGWRTGGNSVEGRWTLTSKGILQGIEVRGSDTRNDVPAGTLEGPSDKTATEVQRYIRDSVRAGDAVSVRLSGIGEWEDDGVRYAILHRQTVVGELSEAFVEALRRCRLPKRRGSSILPQRIEGLRVESVDTVAGTLAASERAGLQGWGIWNRVRVFGLGEVIYPSAGSGVWVT